MREKGEVSVFMGPEPFSGVPIMKLISEIKTWGREIWVNYWNNLPGLRHSKLFIGGPDASRGRKLTGMDRHMTHPNTINFILTTTTNLITQS